MSHFCVSWKVDSHTNFDAFLKDIGMNVVFRKLAAANRPTVTISRRQIEGEEDLWTFKMDTFGKSSTTHFWLSSPFVETTIDDRECDSEWFFEQDQRVRSLVILHPWVGIHGCRKSGRNSTNLLYISTG